MIMTVEMFLEMLQAASKASQSSMAELMKRVPKSKR
jgi:hypothetical protein